MMIITTNKDPKKQQKETRVNYFVSIKNDNVNTEY